MFITCGFTISEVYSTYLKKKVKIVIIVVSLCTYFFNKHKGKKQNARSEATFLNKKIT